MTAFALIRSELVVDIEGSSVSEKWKEMLRRRQALRQRDHREVWV